MLLLRYTFLKKLINRFEKGPATLAFSACRSIRLERQVLIGQVGGAHHLRCLLYRAQVFTACLVDLKAKFHNAVLHGAHHLRCLLYRAQVFTACLVDLKAKFHNAVLHGAREMSI
ncbi:uncharacterized protein [Miscanthus floridulus]|uniref:uncharacterized protein n=1 Tax=Miscanthus floridulus TaxID=154761 RepID=UPI003459489D